MKRAILIATAALLIGTPLLSSAEEVQRRSDGMASQAPPASPHRGAKDGPALAEIGQGRPGDPRIAFGAKRFFRRPAPPYRYPVGFYGWTNHVWRRGEWVPPVFISAAYFVNNWSDCGLWRPAYGYEWIRIGADVVLVNLGDGQVVDAVPGVYYD